MKNFSLNQVDASSSKRRLGNDRRSKQIEIETFKLPFTPSLSNIRDERQYFHACPNTPSDLSTRDSNSCRKVNVTWLFEILFQDFTINRRTTFKTFLLKIFLYTTGQNLVQERNKEIHWEQFGSELWSIDWNKTHCRWTFFKESWRWNFNQTVWWSFHRIILEKNGSFCSQRIRCFRFETLTLREENSCLRYSDLLFSWKSRRRILSIVELKWKNHSVRSLYET